MADKVKCPECKSTSRIWAKGLVPSRSGPKQRYICFACGRTFYKPKAEPKPTKPKADIRSKSNKRQKK
jgi:transposase-like protein